MYKEHLVAFLEGAEEWNDWHANNIEIYSTIGIRADLAGYDLSQMDLTGYNLNLIDFSGANLSGSIMSYCNIKKSIFNRANLTGAFLDSANLEGSELIGANLRGADLFDANLSFTSLDFSDLSNAILNESNLKHCVMSNVNLTDASIKNTFGNGKEIRSLNCFERMVVYTEDKICIGCQNHSIEKWFNITDKELMEMSPFAKPRWRKWEPIIKMIIAEYPATPYFHG